MKLLKSVNKALYRFSKELGSALLGVLILIITAHVVARFVFKNPFVWTEELAAFLFIWISFMGAVVASYEKRHVCVDFLVKKLPMTVQDMIKILTYIAILVFMVLLIIGSFILFPKMMHVSVALRIPKFLYYAAICMASVEKFLMYVREMIEYIQDLRKRCGSGTEEDIA